MFHNPWLLPLIGIAIPLLYGVHLAWRPGRSYTHAGFVVGMPVGSPARLQWASAGKAHLRSAGVLYGWGLRSLVLVAPILVSLVHAGTGVVAALLVTGLLVRLDNTFVADTAPTPSIL